MGFLFLSIIYWFSSSIYDFFVILGNILCVIVLRTLHFLKYYNYGILFGGVYLISRPTGRDSFQGPLFQGGSLIEFM